MIKMQQVSERIAWTGERELHVRTRTNRVEVRESRGCARIAWTRANRVDQEVKNGREGGIDVRRRERCTDKRGKRRREARGGERQEEESKRG